MGQVIVGLSNEFFGCQEGVYQESSTGNLSGYPLRATVAAITAVELFVRDALLLHAANSTPVTDLKVLHS